MILFKAMLVVYFIYAISLAVLATTPINAMTSHHERGTSAFARDDEVCKKTTLYTLTSHPEKENMILCHPVGKALEKQNQANEKFNEGVVLAQHTTGSKCPSSNKDVCDGFLYTKKYEPIINTTVATACSEYTYNSAGNQCTPYQSGYFGGIADGKANARDWGDACGSYFSKALDSCLSGYNSGFPKGCELEGNKLPIDPHPEYGQCRG